MFKPHRIDKKDVAGFVTCRFGLLPYTEHDKEELVALSQLYDKAVKDGYIMERKGLPRVADLKEVEPGKIDRKELPKFERAHKVLLDIGDHARRNVILIPEKLCNKIDFVMERLGKRFMSIEEVKHHFPEF